LPIEYSGSNLVINTPNINEDVTLLKIRKNIDHRLEEMGSIGEHNHSHVLMSGVVETQAIYRDIGTGATQSDIDLSTVELDTFILGPSSWTSGYMALAYDNDPSASFNQRVSNSRVYVNKAYLIFGNFAQSPVYGSMGQMYVPFGAYHTNMVSSPLPKLLARTKARAVNIGYQGQDKSAPFGSVFIFRGDSYPSPTASQRINNGGISLGYRFKGDTVSGSVATGVIANIADSSGMQDTGNSPLFDGFGGKPTNSGAITGNELLVHRVPAYDLRGLLAIGDHWDFLAEYITASTSFNPNDLSFDSVGAKPSALNAEAAFTYTLSDGKPGTIAVGYGFTKQALALGLPAQRYALTFNTSYWRNTLESIEFRHDVDYAASATSSGSTVTGPTGTGTSNNIVTAQFDLYF
jgi:hypothetical protein